jgi:hypothetical protein
MVFFLAPGCSSRFPDILGAEVDDAWDDSWRGSFMAWLYLAAMPSHVGVDVVRLAFPLQCCMVHRLDEGIGPPTRHCLFLSLQ